MVLEREYGVEDIVEKRRRILFIEKEEEWDGINMMERRNCKTRECGKRWQKIE
jgi:hypothetical protein